MAAKHATDVMEPTDDRIHGFAFLVSSAFRAADPLQSKSLHLIHMLLAQNLYCQSGYIWVSLPVLGSIHHEVQPVLQTSSFAFL